MSATELARLEAIIDTSEIATRIEVLLPVASDPAS